MHDRDCDRPSSLIAIRDVKMMITMPWNCHFRGHSIITPALGLVTAARAGVKAGLAVYLAVLLQQSLLSTIGQFLGLGTKEKLVLCYFIPLWAKQIGRLQI